MANGIIIIDKPAGWTSMDVCAKLRGILKTKKVGHAGTLDPMATGVLPVFVGQATRAVSFAEDGEKEYIAGLRLGLSTHDHEELDRALSCDPDYVALGPVWPTILKQMPFAPQGLARVAEWKRLIGARPLVAIGGLSVDRGRQALDAGADIVAAVTDITLNPDPEARMRLWLAAT